jgi:H+/Cl- antiporter ClcA
VLLLLVSGHYDRCMWWPVGQFVGIAVFAGVMASVLVLLWPAATPFQEVRRRRYAVAMTQVMVVVALLEVLMAGHAGNGMATLGWVLNLLASGALLAISMAVLRVARLRSLFYLRELLLTHALTRGKLLAGGRRAGPETPAADPGGVPVPE